MENLPMTPVKEPVALPQTAWVTSNADPEGRGRVQVEFQWQKKLNKTTNWIRVATPDAGSSGAVGTNRGFVFIPEVGDQVMVNFENGDPNRPYVSSSIFAENKSAGGKTNNAIKSIFTRSGIQIVFNDDDGAGSLHISDPSGNTWDMDGHGNIVVNAPNDITITAGKTMTLNSTTMNVNVGENQTNSIGENQSNSIGSNQETMVGDTISITSTDMEETYSNNADTTIGQKQTINAGETDHFTLNGDMVIKAAGKALLQGNEDARISKG